MSRNTDLAYLYCDNNRLTSLDVSKNPALTFMLCAYNQFTELDLSRNTALASLSCENNRLTSLDVSKNLILTGLLCGYNQLTELDLSRNTALASLNCNCNQLRSLDISANIALANLYCYGNQFASLDISVCPNLLLLVNNGIKTTTDEYVQYEIFPNCLECDNGVTLQTVVKVKPDFILPESLIQIGEEAFQGGAFTCVKLSEKTTTIAMNAFADCPNLAYIYIPKTTTDIHPYAFGVKWGGLTVYGEAGSIAETFAQEHGFTFVPTR